MQCHACIAALYPGSILGMGLHSGYRAGIHIHTCAVQHVACLYFSYVLTGTEKGFTETFGSTCHGAVS